MDCDHDYITLKPGTPLDAYQWQCQSCLSDIAYEYRDGLGLFARAI